MTQTSAAERTASRGSTTSAEARLPHTSRGLRRTRSTQAPSTGATSAGIIMKKNVSPALALDPVSVFTHMLRTRSITESPKAEVVRPA